MSFYQKHKHTINDIRRKTVLLLLFPPLLLVIFIFRIIPISWVRRFGRFCGKQFFNLAKKSREWALANLERIYGNELSENERTEIARESFIEILTGFFDYMAYSHVKNKKKYFQLIEVVGEEHLEKAYKRNKGVICLVPHMSSWEFAAITPPMLGYETSAASQSMKMALLEKLIVKFRTSRGMKNITRTGSYQALIEALNKGDYVILMTDQDTRVKGVFVDFLGHSAYTPLGASRLLADTEAALVPMAMTRKEDGNYRFHILPEIPTIKTDDKEADLVANTKNQNDYYSEIIRRFPKQWVWMHRRWKTTPESLAKFLEERRKLKEQK
ncbi:MAG TPA: lysophospholipid acyltransferase family protein [Bacteroidales bacterium]|nr:lysophospholipid acyltransferase family protein [Bacteroidales bacterium]